VIAELQHAVANYAHALDELNVPALEAVLTEDTTWTFTVPGQGVLSRRSHGSLPSRQWSSLSSGIRKSTARGHHRGDGSNPGFRLIGEDERQSIDWKGAGRRADPDRG